ncbi:hypothetical protein FY150_21230 [Agrobacterium tumefaciens]|nr:hypothetical protein FY150_21230 [Agrobacterium tumefaciens]
MIVLLTMIKTIQSARTIRAPVCDWLVEEVREGHAFGGNGPFGLEKFSTGRVESSELIVLRTSLSGPNCWPILKATTPRTVCSIIEGRIY